MLSNKIREEVCWGATAWGLAGQQLVASEQLFSSASLVFLGFYFSIIFLFITIYYYYLISIIKLFSTQPHECSHFHPSNSLPPILLWQGVSEQPCNA